MRQRVGGGAVTWAQNADGAQEAVRASGASWADDLRIAAQARARQVFLARVSAGGAPLPARAAIGQPAVEGEQRPGLLVGQRRAAQAADDASGGQAIEGAF